MARNFGGRRMGKSWSAFAGLSQSFTGGATAVSGGVTVGSATTVLRMLGEYIIGSDAAPTAQDACSLIVGIGVFSSDAFTVGSAAVPNPSSEFDYPWLYWAAHDFFFSEAVLASGGDPVRSIRKSFDIRSMRKMKPSETLGMVVDYVDTSGAPPMQVEVSQTRVLLALN